MFSNKKANNNAVSTAKDKDKIRVEKQSLKPKKEKSKTQAKSTIKRTVLQTLPYEKFVSEYVMRLKSNVKIGKQTANLYSKSYLVPDINYSSLPRAEKELKLLNYIDLYYSNYKTRDKVFRMCYNITRKKGK